MKALNIIKKKYDTLQKNLETKIEKGECDKEMDEFDGEFDTMSMLPLYTSTGIKSDCIDDFLNYEI